MAITSGETNVPIGEWSTGTLKIYHDDKIAALAEANDERHKFYSEMRANDKVFLEERDRRYTEVNIEREKALKIKETADLAALGLAREIQTYKDEKANELREQINSERNIYATKNELLTAISSLTDKLDALEKNMDNQLKSIFGTQNISQGKSLGTEITIGKIYAAIGAVGAILAIIFLVANNTFG